MKHYTAGPPENLDIIKVTKKDLVWDIGPGPGCKKTALLHKKNTAMFNWWPCTWRTPWWPELRGSGSQRWWRTCGTPPAASSSLPGWSCSVTPSYTQAFRISVVDPDPFVRIRVACNKPKLWKIYKKINKNHKKNYNFHKLNYTFVQRKCIYILE